MVGSAAVANGSGLAIRDSFIPAFGGCHPEGIVSAATYPVRTSGLILVDASVRLVGERVALLRYSLLRVAAGGVRAAESAGTAATTLATTTVAAVMAASVPSGTSTEASTPT